MVACLPSLRGHIILLADLLNAGCDNTEDNIPPYSNNGHTEPEPEPEPIDFCVTVNDPGTGSVAFLGGDVPHFEGVNQYGEVVNLCELGGTPMIADISTSWCGPCRYLSEPGRRRAGRHSADVALLRRSVSIPSRDGRCRRRGLGDDPDGRRQGDGDRDRLRGLARQCSA